MKTLKCECDQYICSQDTASQQLGEINSHNLNITKTTFSRAHADANRGEPLRPVHKKFVLIQAIDFTEDNMKSGLSKTTLTHQLVSTHSEKAKH